MKSVYVSYSDLISLVSSKKLLLQFSETSDRYALFAVEANISWETAVLKETADAIDFEENYKGSSNKPLEYRSEDGLPKVANSKFADILSFQAIGLDPLTTPTGTVNYIRYAVNFAYTLSGTYFAWENANFGDYTDFEIGVYFDLQDEESFMVFNTFGDGFNVFQTGNLLIDVPTVKTIPPTVNFGYGDMQVYIRVKYVNSGPNDSKFLVNLIGWRQ